jgi:hypothetical protein
VPVDGDESWFCDDQSGPTGVTAMRTLSTPVSISVQMRFMISVPLQHRIFGLQFQDMDFFHVIVLGLRF